MRPEASRWKSGLPMRRALARRTRSPGVGQARHAPLSSTGSENRLGLHLWRDLPGARQSSRPGAPALHDRGHDPASGGNRASRHAWQPCGVVARPGGWHVSRKLKVPPNITLLPLPAKAPELNPVENIWQYHPGRTGFPTGLHVLHRHTRSLLCSLEQADRSTLDHHVHRPARISIKLADVPAVGRFRRPILRVRVVGTVRDRSGRRSGPC